MGFLLMILVLPLNLPTEHYSIFVETPEQCIALGNTTMREYSEAGVKAIALCQKSFEI